MTQVKFDPTWNHIPRTAILYSLPLAMFSACLYVHGGWIGWSRDFWVPFLWGLVIPLYNTRYRAGRGWALKDFMNRDMYPPTLALTYATAWYLSVTLAPNLPLAMIAFFVFFYGYVGKWLLYFLVATTFSYGFLGFTFDYLPHHPHDTTGADNPYRATAVRLGAEWLLTPLFIYHNYHLIHHLWPRVPFYRYGAVWRAKREMLARHQARVVSVFGKEWAVR